MAIQIRQLTKSYKGPDGSVVNILNVEALDLTDGEQVAMVGSSGSGKTTLLHSIAGIVVPDSGSIVFEDRSAMKKTDVTKLSEADRDVFRGRHVGYVFQTHHLLSGFSAMENILLGLSFTGRSADSKWAEFLLNSVGLSDRADYKPAKLSVGQQQRVAVARALANRPGLVLADEPTGSLDPTNASQVLDLIRSLCRQVGASLLLVTHDKSIASKFDRVVELSEINKAA